MSPEIEVETGQGQERDIVAEAIESYLRDRVPVRIVVGEWDPDSIIPRLTPRSSLQNQRPGEKYPDAIKKSHIHFDDIIADPADGGVHRVDVITYPTEKSREGVFLHEVNFGNDRVAYVVAPADLHPLQIIGVD